MFSPVRVVWFQQETSGLTLRSLKRVSHHPFTVQPRVIAFHCSHRKAGPDAPASDASQHCVALAVASVVNVDLEPWQLLRVQLVPSFPPDSRGPDNVRSLRRELNLLVCRSQVNKTGKQSRESAVLLSGLDAGCFQLFTLK